MVDYSPATGSERFAELVHHHDVESGRQHERLKDLPTGRVKNVLFDGREGLTARANALLLLLKRRDPELSEILLRLRDDPGPRLWLTAIRSFRPTDPCFLKRLRLLLEDPREEVRSEAACALAVDQDEETLARVLAWLEGSDESHRNVAMECPTRYERPEALHALGQAWDRGGRSEEDRVVLGVAQDR